MSKGIEGVSNFLRYWVDSDRVFQETERNGISYYDWPIHISEKECVPVFPFLQAFLKAIRYYARETGLKVDEQMLGRSLEKAITYNVFEL